MSGFGVLVLYAQEELSTKVSLVFCTIRYQESSTDVCSSLVFLLIIADGFKSLW